MKLAVTKFLLVCSISSVRDNLSPTDEKRYNPDERVEST